MNTHGALVHADVDGCSMVRFDIAEEGMQQAIEDLIEDGYWYIDIKMTRRFEPVIRDGRFCYLIFFLESIPGWEARQFLLSKLPVFGFNVDHLI